MKLIQYYEPGIGVRTGCVQDNYVYDLSALHTRWKTIKDLLEYAKEVCTSIERLLSNPIKNAPPKFSYEDLEKGSEIQQLRLDIPIYPQEVWAFGVTYKRSADFRDEDIPPELHIYNKVYKSERPECFFKSTASRCVAHNQHLCIRRDSTFSASEPELAYVVDDEQNILGYTICNDFSAWDIERENPLYLPQSKIFQGCCGLGPCLVTPEEINPFNVKLSMRVIRNEKIIFSESINTSRIGRKFENLNTYLFRDNPIPFGTVVSTGTGIILPQEHAHQDGDIVEIEIEGIGLLRNRVKQLK